MPAKCRWCDWKLEIEILGARLSHLGISFLTSLSSFLRPLTNKQRLLRLQQEYRKPIIHDFLRLLFRLRFFLEFLLRRSVRGHVPIQPSTEREKCGSLAGGIEGVFRILRGDDGAVEFGTHVAVVVGDAQGVFRDFPSIIKRLDSL